MALTFSDCGIVAENNVAMEQRVEEYRILNKCILKWFHDARSRDLPVSGPILQEKARQIAAMCNFNYFFASNYWLALWKKQYNVKLATLSGSNDGVDRITTEKWIERLHDKIKGYRLVDIFNADETSLSIRALPKRSLVSSSDPCIGVKTPKERVTILLACSASGEKLKPVVIGREANPLPSKGKSMSSLPVTYRHNEKACMTSRIFQKWLKDLNDEMKSQERWILLLLDNSLTHARIKLSHVKLFFLPPGTTSKFQPLDAGIIQQMKAHYKKFLQCYIQTRMDFVPSATNMAESINLLDVIGWIKHAWDKVKPKTIQKWFLKCHIQKPEENWEEEETEEVELGAETESEVIKCNDMLVNMIMEKFKEMESNSPAVNADCDYVAQGGSDEGEDEREDEESEKKLEQTINSQQAHNSISDIERYAQKKGDNSLVELLQKGKRRIQEIFIAESPKAKQTKVTDYFKRTD